MRKDEAFRLLVGNGFAVRAVEPKPNYHLFRVERTELLGTSGRYHIVVTGGRLTPPDVDSIARGAARARAAPVLVSDCAVDAGGIPVLTTEQFADRLGGPILSLLPLDPEFPHRLVELGHNRLPPGLQGDPSDLFEQYVHAALQYLFWSRVIRYGQERRFEKVADGVAVGDGAPLVMYDAKAYGEGYDVVADSIRQFSGYVQDFHRKYERQLGRLTSFLVVSGKFAAGTRALENKCSEMRAETGVGLCFVAAEVLADVVSLMVARPISRTAINWRRILVETVLTKAAVEDQLKAVGRDAALT